MNVQNILEAVRSFVLHGGWESAGAIVGLLGGFGLWLIVLGLPWSRSITLDQRLGPYVTEVARPSSLLTATTVTTSPGRGRRQVAEVVAFLGARLDAIVGGRGSVRSRLLRAGQGGGVERFRAEQVIWGALAAVIALVFGLTTWRTRGTSPAVVVILVVCAVIVGGVARDQWLSYCASRREQRMLAEFPTLAELLALAVSAGEGASGALDRVCRLARGELAGELNRCLADARAGASLPVALRGLADRTGVPSLARFVDGIVVAVERGTPLAEVLRAQAQDVREGARRLVMEQGGRKEIAMMVPVVFLILPVTILFAVFPGFSLLRLSL